MSDGFLWHRIQFAFTVTYHYLFPQLTMGLAFLIVIFKALALRWQQPVQAELGPLVVGERRTLVQNRVVEEIDSTGTVGVNRWSGSYSSVVIVGSLSYPWVRSLPIRCPCVLTPRAASSDSWVRRWPGARRRRPPTSSRSVVPSASGDAASTDRVTCSPSSRSL